MHPLLHRHRLSVLVVDDLADAAESLATLLEMHGFAARSVTSGEEALGVCSMDPPDVVFLDLMMPGIDGWELARRLSETNPSPLLVAITGCGGEADRRKAAEAGIGLVLLKPVEPGVLIGVLKRFQRVLGVPELQRVS